MHFFSITLLSLSAATLTHANPLQDSYQLQPRAAKDVVCDGVRTYTPQEVNRALQQACRYQNQGVTVPKKKKKGAYPHDFENREKVRLAVEGPWMEFPIMEDGSAYDGEYNEGMWVLSLFSFLGFNGLRRLSPPFSPCSYFPP